MSERILAAAVRINGAFTFSMLPPARHSEVLFLARAALPGLFVVKEEQGFVTSENRFVDRVTAKDIAKSTGSLLPTARTGAELFSEDMW